ncbi:hypothetical protein K7432_014390 [Basidiobolus ranarum]|uniref:ZP domain-containing protein n=1 Tax=Basidiobolus ranarum TaxID=34480 RepID=A0ABR2WHN1_9FUNG
MLVTNFMAPVVLDIGLAVLPSNNCGTNVKFNDPNVIHAGCNLKLQLYVSSHVLNAVGDLNVELYPAQLWNYGVSGECSRNSKTPI